MLSKSTPIRLSLVLAGVVCLSLSAAYSSLQLERSTYRLPTPIHEAFEIADADLVSAFALNYRTFAADIAWIGAVVEYGESTRTDTYSEHFLQNGFTLSDLDPRFRRIYDWFPNVFVTRSAVPSEDELDEANRLIERGMSHYPNDGELPYSAALNYVGYGSWISEERRLRETRRGIGYLEQAIARQGAPANAPFVLQWFKQREARLTGQSTATPAEEAESLARMLLSVEDPGTRKRIERQLAQMDDKSEAARRSLRHEQELRERTTDSELGFLPTDLWIVTTQP